MELRKIKGKDELDNIRQAAKMLDFAYGVAEEVTKAAAAFRVHVEEEE
jgi:Xaa-Pro aminopeptidase